MARVENDPQLLSGPSFDDDDGGRREKGRAASRPPFSLNADKELTIPSGERLRPLVVDLDGTLVASDLLIEAAFAELGRRPQAVVGVLAALRRGKAALKHRLAASADFDPGILPYDPAVLALIRQARAEGRSVYLASASHESFVGRIAQHLGLFSGWFASSGTTNLAGEPKARTLTEAFGLQGFDYVGNDTADLPVWAQAARAITVRAPAHVRKTLALREQAVEHLPHERPTWRTWARGLRVHQYAKNALIFVPLLASHQLSPGTVLQALTAFLAFCLCASSVYLLNDLVDLQDDRRHRTKCTRPLACGAIPLLHALVAIPVLFLGALVAAALVSLPFLGVLLGYCALTTAYSFALKRVMIVDVITLAGLYSVRVLAGAVATGVGISEWLLAFCMMIFMSLALIKRYVELAARHDANQPDPTSRDYKTSDLDIVAALAAAAGFNAVTIFTLYISSEAVRKLYAHPKLLWLVVPLLMYWMARVLMLASRRLLNDDPVVFAIKDRLSLGIAGLVALLIVAAI